VSFGQRLALFFILIALVPTLALVGMLILISEDSRRGKADARLASGLETSLAVYEGELSRASKFAEKFAAGPELAAAITSDGAPDAAGLRRFVQDAASEPEVDAVQVVGIDGSVLAAAGADDAIAFAELGLLRGAARNADLRVSTETAGEYAAELQRLTKRELILKRGDQTLASTVTVPATNLEAGEMVDVDIAQGEFRAHLLELDADGEESLLLLGPRKEGGFLAVGEPTLALLIGLLGLGLILAYGIARALSRLHSQVAEQVVKDPLTGLWNRRMLKMLEREMARATLRPRGVDPDLGHRQLQVDQRRHGPPAGRRGPEDDLGDRPQDDQDDRRRRTLRRRRARAGPAGDRRRGSDDPGRAPARPHPRRRGADARRRLDVGDREHRRRHSHR